MKIRLGYVSIALDTNFKFKTITYKHYKKTNDFKKIDEIIIHNLETLYNILKYNIDNEIYFYRMSSALIPLYNYDDININLDNYDFSKIKQLIKNHNIRIDLHPDQFCVLNSTKQEVVNYSKDILKHNYKFLDKLGIKDKVIIIHIGSSQISKEDSLKRFEENFKTLEKSIQNSIVIENDDKIFNLEDTLYLSKKLNIRMVFDYQHYLCNKLESFEKNIKDVFLTWKGLNPKIHFSSKKNDKEFRSHNEYIDYKEFISFIEKIKHINVDLDIMLEAKKKNLALFKLCNDIKEKYKFLNKSTFLGE